jgi:hypothetical protein
MPKRPSGSGRASGLHGRKVTRRGKQIRLTRKTQGITQAQYRERRRAWARAHREKLIVVQPGGHYVDVTVQGSDITKIRARDTAMAEGRGRKDGSRNLAPLNRFMRRYRRHYVTDVETGERINLIMSREELDRSKAQMNMRTREEVDKRYAEDMSEA